MPRQARIDGPGLIHHVIIRGIERRRIYMDRADYKEFLRRLEETKADSQILAWTLMPNDAHFLIQTGREKLSRIMSRLLTGYALC